MFKKTLYSEGGEVLALLLREAVGAPSLEAFKVRLDVALGSLVWWLATLYIAGGLKLDDHYGSFQPRPFYGFQLCGVWITAGFYLFWEIFFCWFGFSFCCFCLVSLVLLLGLGFLVCFCTTCLAWRREGSGETSLQPSST